ncbi:DUF2334 domain-containing protein [Schlesneria paludicola]|uniref:DUF2334 domain-containing protein n=1 Tax=Schlesneria paludicola TaxID=360056 RepID=UPI0012FC22FF|nr:DUF2334 domain-containing protein [Schlesneria paludicola]
MSFDSTQVFSVVLHDVTPRFEKEVDLFVETLSPRIGTAIAGAVVPCWGGEPLTERDRPFLSRIQARFGNLLLHGFTHTRARGRGLVSRVAAGLDEMNGLTPEETDQRLSDGQAEMQRWLGSRAKGFIAPTFQVGHASPQRLARHGIDYTIGYRKLVRADGTAERLATWCWDVSPRPVLNHAGYWLGELQYRLQRAAIPCLALHPLDVGRGFLPQICQTVDKLLDAGRKPVLFEGTRAD